MAVENKISRKEQVILIAEKLFRQKSFAGTSVRDITNELGVESSAIYHHFKSKDEILETICFRIADKFITAIEEVNDLYFNAEEKLRMAIANHVKIITNDLDASSVFIREWRHLNSAKMKEFISLRDKYEKGFTEILYNGENENVFDAPDKKFAVLTILSALNWLTEWYSPKGNMTPEEISEHLFNFILSGLRIKTEV